MNHPSSIFNHAKPTTKDTSPVFKANPSAAVYRSLEVPLSSPHSFPSSLSGASPAFPELKAQVGKGEVKWSALQTEVVPPSPGLFVPSESSFELPSSLGSLRQATATLRRSLDKLNVDIETTSSFEWTCSIFENFTETSFVLRLFSTRLVDLQRESGCAFAFCQLFRALKAEVVGEAAPPPRKLFKCLDLPAEMKDDFEPKACPALAEICSSPQIDVQRQGLHVMATSAGEEPHAISPAQVMELLTKTKDVQVRRLATSSLNSLTKQSIEVDKLVLQEEVLRSLVSFVLDERECAETRRQAGGAVCNLARSPSKLPLVRPSAACLCGVNSDDVRLNEILGDLRGLMAN